MAKKKAKTSRIEAFYKVYGKYYVDPTLIMIPRSSKRIVDRMSKKKLKTIHRDSKIAKEKILIFLSEFYQAHLMFLKDKLEYETVDIHSDVIKKIFGTRKYKIALELMYNCGLLVKPENKSYKVGGFSTPYLLDNDMIYKPFVKYLIMSEALRKKHLKLAAAQIRLVMSNPIARSSVHTSVNITYPTTAELRVHANKLIDDGWSNKGKKLAFEKDRKKNDKHIQELIAQGISKEKLPKYYYVEKGVSLYNSLVENRLMLPKIGGYKSGGRVTTAFTLMPKWIRMALKIDNSSIVGVDFSALHPNIALAKWGDGTTITHAKVAEYLRIPIHTAKIEHLKFFNTTVSGMEKMKIHTYYKEKQPEMLEKIKATKKKHTNAHHLICLKQKLR
jgi:hypothetical protein